MYSFHTGQVNMRNTSHKTLCEQVRCLGSVPPTKEAVLQYRGIISTSLLLQDNGRLLLLRVSVAHCTNTVAIALRCTPDDWYMVSASKRAPDKSTGQTYLTSGYEALSCRYHPDKIGIANLTSRLFSIHSPCDLDI